MTAVSPTHGYALSKSVLTVCLGSGLGFFTVLAILAVIDCGLDEVCCRDVPRDVTRCVNNPSPRLPTDLTHELRHHRPSETISNGIPRKIPPIKRGGASLVHVVVDPAVISATPGFHPFAVVTSPLN